MTPAQFILLARLAVHTERELDELGVQRELAFSDAIAAALEAHSAEGPLAVHRGRCVEPEESPASHVSPFERFFHLPTACVDGWCDAPGAWFQGCNFAPTGRDIRARATCCGPAQFVAEVAMDQVFVEDGRSRGAPQVGGSLPGWLLGSLGVRAPASLAVLVVCRPAPPTTNGASTILHLGETVTLGWNVEFPGRMLEVDAAAAKVIELLQEGHARCPSF